ncbi:hypothetical protein SSP531S_45070 [Streptomyces spongiicola]|uniref:Uncharacterized protein n=1 Tax=Streptomyces spongiicola TaxID=1690221 RepID=A0A388T4E5_9ACTN|nr:hypothetical protein SSP531S_45070 [Streptomyces spongiicola]
MHADRVGTGGSAAGAGASPCSCGDAGLPLPPREQGSAPVPADARSAPVPARVRDWPEERQESGAECAGGRAGAGPRRHSGGAPGGIAHTGPCEAFRPAVREAMAAGLPALAPAAGGPAGPRRTSSASPAWSPRCPPGPPLARMGI